MTFTLFLSLLVSVASFEAPKPTCKVGRNGTLMITWESIPSSDYYELGVASSENGQAHAVYSTARTYAELTMLLPETAYWLNLRAHKTGMPSLGPGTWGEVGPRVKCMTGKLQSQADFQVGSMPKNPPSFFLEVLRESEYTSDVDYLMNHDSGDILGDVALLTATYTKAPWLSGGNFSNSTLTLYCVEVLDVNVPDTVTTDGDNKFADYLSCDDNGNATDPLCDCDNYIDRALSTAPISPYCKMQSGEACPPIFRPDAMKECKCTCTPTSLRNSHMYMGMMKVRMGGQTLGKFFSHPKETECTEFETIGTTREDGSRCTWKRRADARVLRGWEIEKHGWNTTESKTPMQVDPSQVRQNVEVMKNTFSNTALRPWECEAQSLRPFIV